VARDPDLVKVDGCVHHGHWNEPFPMWRHECDVSQVEIYQRGACRENVDSKHVDPRETFELVNNCTVDEAPVHNDNHEV